MRYDGVNPSIDFPCQPNPPTTEEIHRAMRARRWQGTDTSKGALDILFGAGDVEQFNFGPLSLDTLREVQKEALEFMEFGCLSLPYPICVFRCSVQFDNRTVGFHIFAVSRSEDTGRTAIISTVHSAEETLTFRCDHTFKTVLRPAGRGTEVFIPKAELQYWEPAIGKIAAYDDIDNSNGAIITEGALILTGLLMILNTRGVLKERSAPPAKPNKVRAARGVPLIPYTTKVYTTVYNQAVRKGAQGTHASPRPHRRRAHIRHYPKTEKHEAYIKPIEAMLVNWDGKPLVARAEYQVKT